MSKQKTMRRAPPSFPIYEREDASICKWSVAALIGDERVQLVKPLISSCTDWGALNYAEEMLEIGITKAGEPVLEIIITRTTTQRTTLSRADFFRTEAAEQP